MINATGNVPKPVQQKPVPLVSLKKTNNFSAQLKKRRNLLIAAAIFLVLVIGGVVSYILSQTSQEIRHQASTGVTAPGCGSVCTTVTDCPAGFTCTAGKCDATSCHAP